MPFGDPVGYQIGAGPGDAYLRGRAAQFDINRALAILPLQAASLQETVLASRAGRDRMGQMLPYEILTAQEQIRKLKASAELDEFLGGFMDTARRKVDQEIGREVREAAAGQGDSITGLLAMSGLQQQAYTGGLGDIPREALPFGGLLRRSNRSAAATDILPALIQDRVDTMAGPVVAEILQRRGLESAEDIAGLGEREAASVMRQIEAATTGMPVDDGGFELLKRMSPRFGPVTSGGERFPGIDAMLSREAPAPEYLRQVMGAPYGGLTGRGVRSARGLVEALQADQDGADPSVSQRAFGDLLRAQKLMADAGRAAEFTRITKGIDLEKLATEPKHRRRLLDALQLLEPYVSGVQSAGF